MNWAPSERNQAGELLASGLASAGQSIGEGIRLHRARTQELKGYQTLLTALAEDPTSGVNKDSIDKMSLEQAKNSILATEIRRQNAARKQQTAGRASIPSFLASVSQAQQPTANMPDIGNTYNSLVNGTMPAPTPGADGLTAVIRGLRQNPAVLDTDAGKDALASVVKRMVAPPASRMPLPFSMNGVSGVVDPATGRITQPRPVPVARPTVTPGATGRGNAASSLDPDEELMPYTPQGAKAPIPGLYRRMKGGKPTGYWQDPQAAPRVAGGTSFADLLKAAGDGSPDASAPAAAPATSGPAAGTVIQGYQFKGGDPADKNNWTPVGE